MDSNCRKLGETPYRECRKQAAIYNDALGSMERAAEMLGVSVNTLSNYELGVTVPPVDIIIVMADLYRAPQLKTMYCKNECLIGRCMPVAVEAGSIDNIVIRIIKQFKESRIEGLKDKLIGIAEDGKVSEEEEKELNEICQELDEMVKTVGILINLWLWGMDNASMDGLMDGADIADIALAIKPCLSESLDPEEVVSKLLDKVRAESDKHQGQYPLR